MRLGKVIAFAVVIAAAVLLFVLRPAPPDDADRSGNGSSVADAPRQPGDAGRSAVTPGPGGPARNFVIDASRSEVYWRIYRAGAAARFGHNHVISIGEMQGSVTLGSDPAAAEWELSFPVLELIVDDPEIRARYGEDFESVPSEEDKSGTRDNMLTDRVLNGAMYPEIRLHGSGASGPLTSASLAVTIEMLGRSIEQSFPASITIDGETLTVVGEKSLTHAELGLEPFTAFGGLMAVGDNIDLTYRIEAIAGN